MTFSSGAKLSHDLDVLAVLGFLATEHRTEKDPQFQWLGEVEHRNEASAAAAELSSLQADWRLKRSEEMVSAVFLVWGIEVEGGGFVGTFSWLTPPWGISRFCGFLSLLYLVVPLRDTHQYNQRTLT